MSAITGIYYRNGDTVDPVLIRKINDKVSHRGPDGSTIWCDGPIAFGHQMLYTTPESTTEQLPFQDKETGLIITADARIDNRNELSQELDIEDKVDISDSYFILKSYEKWGEKCPEYLIGDFAFAIWNEKEERLFCARDHMGVKPFYYHYDDDIFVFGTDIKSLLSVPGISYKLNELKVADYLTHFVEERESTFFDQILRLPAAFFIDISFNKLIKQCYWELDPKKETIMDSDDQYAEKFLQIFTESMKCRMRSAYPIGSFLSGGLDSSSIVCTARNILLQENSDYYLKTFSAVYDDLQDCDEHEYIAKVLNKGRLNPYLLKTNKISPLIEIDNILEVIGQPFNTPNFYIHLEIFKKAQREDVRILFDGFDGDTTVFYEERYFLDLAREMQWKKLIKELKSYANKNETNFIKIFLYVLVLPIIPQTMKNYLQKVLNFLGINVKIVVDEHLDMLNNKFVQSTGFKKRFKCLYEDPLNKANTNKLRHNFRLSSPYLQYAMEILNLFASNYSIEPVYPFFDLRLVEFCLSLPKEQKFSKMWDRIVMRRAMEGILPKEIQWRMSKTGMGKHFKRNMLLFDKETLENAINSNSDIISEYVDIKNLSEKYELYKNGVEEDNAVDLWLAVMLINWLIKLPLNKSDSI